MHLRRLHRCGRAEFRPPGEVKHRRLSRHGLASLTWQRLGAMLYNDTPIIGMAKYGRPRVNDDARAAANSI